MLKKFVKLFLILSVVFSFTVNINSFAETITDPDLDLSIEKLRKKYPITWLSEKYGDNNWCLDWKDAENIPNSNNYSTKKDYEDAKKDYKKYSKSKPPKNLICSFYKKQNFQEPYKEMNFGNFSENEIKSIFAMIPEERDLREQQIIGIVFRFFEEKENSVLTPTELRIKNFIFSKRIIKQFHSSCGWISSEFDLKTLCSLTQK